jgi:poly-beta-1,6-N-acetyl-D-glucosamine synthase
VPDQGEFLLRVAFWVSVGLIVYTYFGYPLLIYLISKTKPAGGAPAAESISQMPFVSLIIPACNEELWIERKIKNTLALDYPADRMEMIVASDGSTDRTVEIVREYESSGIAVAAFPARQGKQEMLNHLVPRAAGEIIVATDTHAMLERDALRNLVRHFADPAVGGITGRRVCILQAKSTASVGESLYWRYESWIKESESRLHSCLGAHGQLYAIRKSAFPHVEKVGEDFFIPMKVIAEIGLRIIYEPSAVAAIPAAASLRMEFERKARAHVSFLLTLPMLKKLLLPWSSPVWWQYISHHVLRMTVPPALLIVLISSAVLAPADGVFLAAFLLQAVFYALAAIGALFARRGVQPKVFYIPFYFTFVNAAVGLALLRWPAHRFDYAWQRTERLPDPH